MLPFNPASILQSSIASSVASKPWTYSRQFLEPLGARNCVEDLEGITKWTKTDVCKVGLDGRLIRNILASAVGLARAVGKKKLDQADLKTVFENVKEYKDDFAIQFERYRSSQEGMVGKPV